MMICSQCDESLTGLTERLCLCEVCGQERACCNVLWSRKVAGLNDIVSGDEAPIVKRIRALENCLMVLDVTLFCLAASGNIDPLFMGQVRAAAEAYKHATGEESMLVENRCKKDFTREAKTAD